MRPPGELVLMDEARRIRVTYRHSHLNGKGGVARDFIEIIDAAVECDDVKFHTKWDLVSGIMLMRKVQGFTVCTIELDGVEVARGYALCSREDQFCRKIGRQIAFGRARKKLPLLVGGEPSTW